MMTIERTYYDRGLKKKAVELSNARGNAKQIADELKINPDLLYRWRRGYEKYQIRWYFHLISHAGFFL